MNYFGKWCLTRWAEIGDTTGMEMDNGATNPHRNSRRHQYVLVADLPVCDYCHAKGVGKLAEYDFQTTYLYWANGCAEHYEMNRRYDTLGLGKGQKLVLKLPE